MSAIVVYYFIIYEIAFFNIIANQNKNENKSNESGNHFCFSFILMNIIYNRQEKNKLKVQYLYENTH